MTQLDPIIATKDVVASSNWYQSLLGCKSMHGGTAFDILVSDEGEVLLCLHQWESDGHPTMMDRTIPLGNGLILYFRTRNLEMARENANKLKWLIEEELHLNPNSGKFEFALRDPDGYYVIVTEYHRYEG